MRIFLLGFMGTGKSHWGKHWGAAHHIPFIDLDKEIESEAALTVAEIFERKGEEYFRNIEANVLRSLSKYANCIVACGGGTPCFHNNIEWMNENGHTIFLEARPGYLLENIEREKGKRPLIKNLNEAELLFFIEQKLKERKPFYNQAAVTLSAEKLTTDSFEDIIQTLIN